MNWMYPRTVTQLLTVTFRGLVYDVSDVPGVKVGVTVNVVFFADEWKQAVHVIKGGGRGDVLLTRCPRVERDAAGFRADAPIIDGKDAPAANVGASLVGARQGEKRRARP